MYEYIIEVDFKHFIPFYFKALQEWNYLIPRTLIRDYVRKYIISEYNTSLSEQGDFIRKLSMKIRTLTSLAKELGYLKKRSQRSYKIIEHPTDDKIELFYQRFENGAYRTSDIIQTNPVGVSEID